MRTGVSPNQGSRLLAGEEAAKLRVSDFSMPFHPSPVPWTISLAQNPPEKRPHDAHRHLSLHEGWFAMSVGPFVSTSAAGEATRCTSKAVGQFAVSH